MEVASSRPDHLPLLSAAKTTHLSLLVKSPFGSGAADVVNATPTFCFSVPAISKLTTLTVESLWTEPTETPKHHILAIDEGANNNNKATGVGKILVFRIYCLDC